MSLLPHSHVRTKFPCSITFQVVFSADKQIDPYWEMGRCGGQGGGEGLYPCPRTVFQQAGAGMRE